MSSKRCLTAATIIAAFYWLLVLGNAFDPVAKYKPCFERYNGHKLVGVQPFHSEWRIMSEEYCLEFCVKTASRCVSIVFDRTKHICHYFSVNGIEANGVERHQKFVYLQATSRHCLEQAMVEGRRPKPANETNEQNGKEELVVVEGEAVPVDRKKTQDGQSMSAIFERIDAELREQQGQKHDGDMMPAAAETTTIAAEVDGKQPQSPYHRHSLLPILNKFAMKTKTAGMEWIDGREIRRHPRIDDAVNNNGAKKEEEEAEDKQMPKPSTDGMTHSCDHGSNVIWLAVENSHFNATEEVSRNTASVKECPAICDSLEIQGRTCNAFTFDERQMLCNFSHSENALFPGSLVHSSSADFSQRSFRQFCYPGTFAAFNGCSEFLSFTDYKLEMEPREVFDGLPLNAEGVSACIELCALSNEFKCMSGLIDVAKGICRLYDAHSLSNPNAFQNHSDQGQLYFENGCMESVRSVIEEDGGHE